MKDPASRDLPPPPPADWLARLEKLHPHKMMLNLAMIGSALIFGYLMVAYAYTRIEVEADWQMTLPKPFVVSTLVIVFSSFWLFQAKKSFAGEQFGLLKKHLGYVLSLGTLFMALQLWGWWNLIGQDVTFRGNQTSAAYLYLMSGLHLLHLLVGLLFLLSIWRNVGRASKDPVKSLITATTPYQQVRISMLVSFWHYLDVVWVVMFFFFLFTL